MSSSASTIETIRPDRLIYRPYSEFLKLPLRFRWEVIRRHPYYIRWWQAAGQSVSEGDITQERLQRVARLILYSAIQVECAGPWPDPATSYEAIGSHPGLQPFQGGTLAPITRRAHLMQLTLGLNWASFRDVVQSCIQLLPLSQRDEEGRYELAETIRYLDIEQLDEISNSCVFSFNPHAPLESIMKDFRALAKRVKRERNIRETRTRVDKIREYLEVWDARERWENGSYSHSPPPKLNALASRFRRPIRTITDQYRSAFKIIVGHAYTPENWLAIVAAWKWREHTSDLCARRVGRPLHERTRREPPVSRIVAHAENTEFLGRAGITNEELAFKCLLAEIKDRIHAGDDEDAIYETLELSNRARESRLVEHIRQHLNEF